MGRCCIAALGALGMMIAPLACRSDVGEPPHAALVAAGMALPEYATSPTEAVRPGLAIIVHEDGIEIDLTATRGTEEFGRSPVEPDRPNVLPGRTSADRLSAFAVAAETGRGPFPRLTAILRDIAPAFTAEELRIHLVVDQRAPAALVAEILSAAVPELRPEPSGDPRRLKFDFIVRGPEGLGSISLEGPPWCDHPDDNPWGLRTLLRALAPSESTRRPLAPWPLRRCTVAPTTEEGGDPRWRALRDRIEAVVQAGCETTSIELAIDGIGFDVRSRVPYRMMSPTNATPVLSRHYDPTTVDLRLHPGPPTYAARPGCEVLLHRDPRPRWEPLVERIDAHRNPSARACTVADVTIYGGAWSNVALATEVLHQLGYARVNYTFSIEDGRRVCTEPSPASRVSTP